MRTVHFRSTALGAAAVLTLAGSVAAQEKPSGLLNSLEVRQLVATGESRDHVRLTAHFTAVGDTYAAEAKRHMSMAQSSVGNPSRNLRTGMSVHCRRLAALNTQSARTARELGAYHEKLASGSPATPPRDGAPYQAGAGAPEPTEKELNALAAAATTPTEHRTLEEYFRTLAKRYTAEGNQHAAFARGYRGTRLGQAAVHHNRLARLSRGAAKEAAEAAEMHKAMAGGGR